jgi:hypothetical protein
MQVRTNIELAGTPHHQQGGVARRQRRNKPLDLFVG